MTTFPNQRNLFRDAGFFTATELLEKEIETENVTSGDQGMDNFLGEGIARGTVTELVGEAGCGKSQFCMTVTGANLARGSTVIYMDTEKSSSFRRMEEIFQLHSQTTTQTKFFQNLMLSTPQSLKDMVIFLTQLIEEKSCLEKASVLIVDSIAYFFRGEQRTDTFHDLDIIQTNLLKIASQFNVSVIITNHITTVGTEEDMKEVACMGQSWKSVPTTRVWLYRVASDRYIRLEKCPWKDKDISKFVIKDRGVVRVE